MAFLILDTFDLIMLIVQGHFKVIQYTCLKMVCNSKLAGRRAKRTETSRAYMYVGYLCTRMSVCSIHLLQPFF